MLKFWGSLLRRLQRRRCQWLLTLFRRGARKRSGSSSSSSQPATDVQSPLRCFPSTRKQTLLGGRPPPPINKICFLSKNACDTVHNKGSGTNHVLVNPWLIPYKLMGWFASLDLRKPYTRCILNHQTASPYALYGILGER